MRVTGGMIRNNSMNSLYNNMGRLDTLFNQMNTLKKIQRPSDDPIIMGRSLKLRLSVMQSEQHKNNVDEATAWMGMGESALSNMTEILKEIRTRCNQAANDTLTTDDRIKIMNEIDQLYKQLQQESNVTYSGRYIFSGYKSDQPVYFTKDTEITKDITLSVDMKVPADTTIGGVNYPAGSTVPAGTTIPAGTILPKDTVNPIVLGNTDGQNIEFEIGVGTTIDVNTLGVPELMVQIGDDIEKIRVALLGDPNTTPPTDPLPEDQLNEFFSGMITSIDERLSTVSEMVADLGSRQNRLEYTETRLLDDKTNLTELLSKTEDVDIEQIYVDFNTQYMVYQSALQATSKVVMANLADFLR